MDRNKKSYIGKQILAALLATIPSFTFAIEIQWTMDMYFMLLMHEVKSWAFKVLPLAAICGIPFFIMASDRFGRKICIIFMSILSCISSIIKIVTFGNFLVVQFILTSVFAGLAAGGCLVVVPVYIKEISEDSVRGALICLTTSMFYLGSTFAFTMDMILTDNIIKIYNGIYLLMTALHILAFCFMPESPSYLLKHRKEDKAAKAIAWLRNLKTNDNNVHDEITKLKEERREFGPKITIMSIFRDRPTFSALRMTLMLVAMKTLSEMWTLTDSFVIDRKLDFTIRYVISYTKLLEIAGIFFTSTLIGKIGRKVPLASGSLTMSLCLAILATCILLDFKSNLLRAIAYCVCKFANGAGLAAIPTVFMAEVFNYEVRTRLVGVTVAFSFILNIIGTSFYPLILNTLGVYVMLFIYSAVILLCVIYTILCVPETKGKSLKQIKEFWQKNPESNTA